MLKILRCRSWMPAVHPHVPDGDRQRGDHTVQALEPQPHVRCVVPFSAEGVLAAEAVPHVGQGAGEDHVVVARVDRREGTAGLPRDESVEHVGPLSRWSVHAVAVRPLVRRGRVRPERSDGGSPSGATRRSPRRHVDGGLPLPGRGRASHHDLLPDLQCISCQTSSAEVPGGGIRTRGASVPCSMMP